MKNLTRISSQAITHLIPASAVLSLTALASAAPQSINYAASVSSDGEFGNADCRTSQVSDNGRYVVFTSGADNFVPGDTNAVWDIFRHDLHTGATELVSESMVRGQPGNFRSLRPDVSADGRFVVFESNASDLVPGDTNGEPDIFIRDMVLGVTERISETPAGVQSQFGNHNPKITPDGRFVTFDTRSRLVFADAGAVSDIYRFDRLLNQLDLVSVAPDGTLGNAGSEEAVISDDGQRIAFVSAASTLAEGDFNGDLDVLLKDMVAGTLTLVGTTAGGAQGAGYSDGAAISGDGGTVAFISSAADLVPNDTNGKVDRFAKDIATGFVERINVRPNGNQINQMAAGATTLSTDGNLVIFQSPSGALVPNDTNGLQDCFIRDRAAASTRRVNLTLAGEELQGFSNHPSMSGDGNFICYQSQATGIVPGDTLREFQIYAVDRTGSGTVGETYCLSNPNSTGLYGLLTATGTTVVSYNQVTLSATQLPTDSFGLFITSRTQGFVANPGGSSGDICLGGMIGRYVGPGEVQDSGSAGRIDLSIDLNAMPQPTGFDVALAGERWNFQLWHRDVTLSGTPTSSFTQGLTVLLR